MYSVQIEDTESQNSCPTCVYVGFSQYLRKFKFYFAAKKGDGGSETHNSSGRFILVTN